LDLKTINQTKKEYPLVKHNFLTSFIKYLKRLTGQPVMLYTFQWIIWLD